MLEGCPAEMRGSSPGTIEQLISYAQKRVLEISNDCAKEGAEGRETKGNPVNRAGGAILDNTKRLLIDPAIKPGPNDRPAKDTCCGVRG